MDSFNNDGDRREFPRYESEILSLIYIDYKLPAEKIVGRTKNISAKGAFFNTKEKLEQKTQVRIEIFLMNDKEKKELSRQIEVIEAWGQVVRTEPDGLAISFNENFETRLSSIEEITGAAL